MNKNNMYTQLLFFKKNVFNYLNIILIIGSPFVLFGQQLEFDHLQNQEELSHPEIDIPQDGEKDPYFNQLKKHITRDEIGGVIWVKDSSHGYYENQYRSRTIVLERDERGNDLHTISYRSKRLKIDGPWINYSQRFIKYDKKNKEVERLYQLWNPGTRQWENNYRYEHQYDINNQVIFRLTQFWDTALMVWIDSWSIKQNYDIKGNLVYYSYQYWNNNSIGNGYFNVEYRYKNDLLDEEIIESWNSIDNDKNKYKIEYTYNNLDLLITKYRSIWDSTMRDWMGRWEHNYKYNSRDSLIEYVYNYWNSSESTWQELKKETNVYDENNNLIEYLWRKFDRGTKQFYNVIHEISKFNSKNQLVKKKYITQDIDQNINDSIETSIYQYSYLNNEDGLPTYILLESWDVMLNEWTNYLQYFNQYDTDNRRVEYLSTRWHEADSIWIMKRLYSNKYDEFGHELEENVYDWTGLQWEELSTYYTFWSEFEITDLEEIEHKYLYVFPNPTTEKVFINDGDLGNHYSVKVFDICGQLRHSSANRQEVDLVNLPSGNYFLHLKWSSGEKTIKIIKQ